MKIVDLLEQSGLTIDWIDDYVRQSSAIDPQPGFPCEPNEPAFDNHKQALFEVIINALQDKFSDPNKIHQIIMREFLEPGEAGIYRKVPCWVGPYGKPDPVRLIGLMERWKERVAREYSQIYTSGQSDVIQDWNKAIVWDLHFEFENIHPWVDGNGRTGRLLMVNHAILFGLKPWILHFGAEQHVYYRQIERHPSHAWGGENS